MPRRREAVVHVLLDRGLLIGIAGSLVGLSTAANGWAYSRGAGSPASTSAVIFLVIASLAAGDVPEELKHDHDHGHGQHGQQAESREEPARPEERQQGARGDARRTASSLR